MSVLNSKSYPPLNTQLRDMLREAGDEIDALPDISSGSGAPGTTPSKVGDIYIDTSGSAAYIATGTSSSSDWEQVDVGAGTTALNDITDVTITSVATGEVLYKSAGDWINGTLAEAGIAAASHTHAASDITSGTFDDARIAGSNVTQHQAALSITESQISDLGAYITGITGEPLSDLSDVTITAIASGELLKWNGAAWINNTLAEAGIQAAGSYLTDIVNDTTPQLGAALDLNGYTVPNNRTLRRVYLNSGSPATWNKPADSNFYGVRVWVVGGGGGGGGSGTTNGKIASGGAGGGVGYKLILAASLGSTETVTTGAGGAGGAAGSNNGSAGGTSSFGSHVSCTGGGGGVHGASTYAAASGGTSTGGDINATGALAEGPSNYTDSWPGHGGAAGGAAIFNGTRFSDVNRSMSPSGVIGQWGGMGGVRADNFTTADRAGAAGLPFGGGGSGGKRDTGSTAGGAGYAGVVVVEELYHA